MFVFSKPLAAFLCASTGGYHAGYSTVDSDPASLGQRLEHSRLRGFARERLENRHGGLCADYGRLRKLFRQQCGGSLHRAATACRCGLPCRSDLWRPVSDRPSAGQRAEQYGFSRQRGRCHYLYATLVARNCSATARNCVAISTAEIPANHHVSITQRAYLKPGQSTSASPDAMVNPLVIYRPNSVLSGQTQILLLD